MIPRYSRPDMVSVWEPANKFRIWYLIEAHATQAQADLGTVPQRAAEAVWKVRERMEARDIDVAAIDEIEAEVKHDVIAFLTWLAGLVGEDSRFVHQGMTSSDVLDTTLAVQLKEAGALLLAGSERLLAALKTRAHELKDVPTIGRSHAIHAEPTTFGLKLAGHYALIHRCHDRLAQAIDEVSTCAISGAVGTFANIDPAVEVHVADALGLHVEPHSTQVIPRDRHAHFFNACALMASAIENLAVEIRHLQRSEVREAEEFFSAGQKGSSAMPHKRNPVL
ncbi:MAG: lyase family protein, partial [Alphaproteobacteria bacterium]